RLIKKFNLNILVILTISLTLLSQACSTKKETKQIAYLETRASDPFEILAKSLSGKGVSKVKKIIVLTFLNQDGREHLLGPVFAEKLTTELVKQKKMIVLDRLVYSKKLKDSGLSTIKNYDLAYLNNLGDLLGVDAIAIGIISPSGKIGYDINCRIIDVKTGLILNAEEVYYTEAGD
ncbi:MAG: hypothetical protein KDK36_19515, partial [Leptospiraceae bacterium]|nr:hypothetical protein [Leptospiraceae bacterium]